MSRFNENINSAIKRMFNIPALETIDLINIVNDGNFSSPNNWGETNATKSIENNELTMLATGTGGRVHTTINVIKGHKYFLKALIKADTRSVGILIPGTPSIKCSGRNVYEIVCGFAEATITGETTFRIVDLRSSGWTEIKIKNVVVIDVTASFNSAPSLNDMLFYLAQFSSPETLWFNGTVTKPIIPAERKALTLKNGVLSPQLTSAVDIVGLVGTKIACFGDSITERGIYPNTIAELTGATTYNVGFGGCRMAYHTSTKYDKFSMSKLADAINTNDWSTQNAAVTVLTDFAEELTRLKSINFLEVDYITIFYGTNDFSGAVPLGTNEDSDSTTFKGAINYIVNTILSAYPHIKILFICPLWRLFGASGNQDVDIVPNSEGIYLHEYVDAIIEMAKINKMPYLDLFRTSGINKYNYTKLYSDTTHPNEKGSIKIGRQIAASLIANQ